MKLRKSALTSLVLGLALIGSACEDKSGDIIIPPPAPSITITPSAAITLAVGETATVSANVAGGDENTDRTVTFSSSNTAVATVGASTGVVTAVAPGTATIIATNAANNLQASVQVIVTGGPGGEPAAPTISVSRITQGNTNNPVNINNVSGQIDVVLNVEVPEGNTVSAINVLIGGTVLPCQTFSTGGASALSAAGAAQVEIVCSYDTGDFVTVAEAAANTSLVAGEPNFLNGPVVVSGQIVMGDGDVVDATNQITIVLNNTNFISATPTFSRGCANSEAAGVAPAGSRWCAGNLTMDLLSVNYDGDDFDVEEVTVGITTSGQGANGVCAGLADDGAGDTDPDCAAVTVSRTVESDGDNTFTVAFEGGTGVNTTAPPAAEATDIAGFEDVVTITVNSITAGGEAGPVCINPDPAGNPQNTTCATAGGNVAFFATPVRIDNLAPRVTLFDITPATLGCDQAACFVNEEFEFEADNDDLIVMEDWGVDAQEDFTFFFAGTDADELVQIQTGVEGFAETVTPTLILQVKPTDKLQNTRSLFATDVAAAPSTDEDDAINFGIDITNPSITGLSPDLDQETDTDATAETVSVTFQDLGTGPSGFGDEPLVVTIEQITSDDVVCYDDAGTEIDCDDAPIEADATIVIPDLDGYWQITVHVVDEAGNESPDTTFLFLDDEVPPTVAGVVAPSTIEGGEPATFSADASDNVELGDVLTSIGYGAHGFYAHADRVEIDDYGVDSFTTETTATFTYDYFIYQLEGVVASGGAFAPAGNPALADLADFTVRDVAGVELEDPCPAPTAADGATTQNCTLRKNNNIVVNVMAGHPEGTTPWSEIDPDLAFFELAVDDASPDEDDGGNVTFSAVATGPQGTFAEPFEFVNFYEQDASGRYILVGQDLAGVPSDDDIQNVRRWAYTFSVPVGEGGNNRIIRAVGVNSGAGLISPDAQFTTVE